MKTEDLGTLILALQHKNAGFFLVEAPDNPTMEDLILKITVAMGRVRKRTAVIDFAELKKRRGQSITRFMQDAVNEKKDVEIFFLRNMESAYENGDLRRFLNNLNHAREGIYYLKRGFIFMMYPDFADSFRKYAPDLLSWIPHKYQFESGSFTPGEFAESVQLIENIRFVGDKDLRYIKDLVELYEMQLDASSDDDTYKIENILKPLADLYEQYGDYALEIPAREKIARFHESENTEKYPEALTSLGKAYLNGVSDTPAENIEKAIGCFEKALESLSRENMPLEWAKTTALLADALRKHPIGDRAANIEKAIRYYRMALEVVGRDEMPVEWARIILNTANAYKSRIRGNHSENIEHAIQYYKQALDIMLPETRPIEWAATKINLANAYGSRIRGDRAGNIEEAIRCFKQGLEIITREAFPAEWARATMYLGNAYSDRIRGDWAENKEIAIRSYKRVLEVISYNTMPTEWAEAMMSLANAYRGRIRGRRSENIEESIFCYKKILEKIGRDTLPVLWAESLINFANACKERIQGDRAVNIGEAIRYYKAAIKIITREANPIKWAAIMVNLANAYRDRIGEDQERYIEKAIRCYEQALEVLTRDALPLQWAEAMMELANAYRERNAHPVPKNGCRNFAGTYENSIADNLYEHDHIEKAIQCYEQILEVISREALPLQWAEAIMNLANAYRDRISGDCGENIEKAIQFYKQVLEIRTKDALPIDWATTVANLAKAYKNRIQGNHKENIENAVLCCEQALEIFTSDTMPSEYREIQRILGYLHLDEGRWYEASNAFYELLKSSDLLYKSSFTQESRQVELRAVQGVAACLAYSLVRSAPGSIAAMRQAVEVLEQNRARRLRESLSLKSGKPEAVPEAVWDEFEIQRKNYNLLLNESRLPQNTAFLRVGDAMRKAMETFNVALSKIREYEADFMSEPDFNQIQSAISSSEEALVYFAVTPVGAMAFIVQQRIEPIIAVRLESLKEHRLSEKTDAFMRSYLKWRTNPKEIYTHTSWFNTLNTTAGWLWDSFMGRLTNKLIESGITRSILIPQGQIGLFPLHAAWSEDRGKRHYALDDIYYTYAPNALARQTANETKRTLIPDRILAINEPSSSRIEFSPPLPNIEALEICKHFREKKILFDKNATKAAVLNAMHNNDVFHFSCHGFADFSVPLNSGLLLSNGENLTLRELFPLELKGARLAVLSGCETGIADLKNTDEDISLPTGFVQAGVAGVVASLWPCNDFSTMILMIRFYNLWRKDDMEPPEALRRAQIWLRDSTNREKLDYFKKLHKTGGISRQAVKEIYRKIGFSDPEGKDFSHPYHWAAFTYMGV